MKFNQLSSTAPRKLAIGTIVLGLIFLIQFQNPGQQVPNMGVTHIVLFQFKPSASPEDISDVSKRMLALKNDCIHPTSKKPYMTAASGGTDNSPEGAQNGITHAFVMEFGSIEDRDYYLNDDPAHGDFKKLAGKILEKVIVVDYTNGEFKL